MVPELTTDGKHGHLALCSNSTYGTEPTTRATLTGGDAVGCLAFCTAEPADERPAVAASTS